MQMNRRKNLMTVASVMIAALATTHANAVTISASSGTTAFSVSNTDLIEGSVPAIAGGLGDREGLNTDTSGGALTNGTFGPAGLTNNPGPNPEVSMISNGTGLTYTLAAPATITDINTYSNWRDGGRVDQDYEVLYTTMGNAGFQSLTTVSQDQNAGNPSTMEVRISDVGLTDVTAIRFAFSGVQNGYVGYTELDVIGTAGGNAVPEPATATLALLGLGGLMMRRRRNA